MGTLASRDPRVEAEGGGALSPSIPAISVVVVVCVTGVLVKELLLVGFLAEPTLAPEEAEVTLLREERGAVEGVCWVVLLALFALEETPRRVRARSANFSESSFTFFPSSVIICI